MVAAVVVVVAAVILVTIDAVNSDFREWWVAHAFTTSIVGGLLVLALTLLVVNQILNFRQVRSRAQATAAQAAILLNQARRATDAVHAALQKSSDRDAASDEVRTYMTMVFIGAPVLIGTSVPRAFLEQAQWLGALLGRALNPAMQGVTPAEIFGALEELKTLANPLLQKLSHSERNAVGAGQSSAPDGAEATTAPNADH
ncbi:hypothetical protein ACPPVQ_04185 [Diaminobutyricibacter sp. McL0618]|uniref:hypothetical protein n=1 Tax=Leifsonia sp. McL0618 TaxID=3415677 RepID=UPI003CEB0CD3